MRPHRPATEETNLAAQCEITPHIAEYPFEIILQREVSHAFCAFCLVFKGYRANIAEIPLFFGGGGLSHLHFACSPGGDMLREGGGGIAPNWPC